MNGHSSAWAQTLTLAENSVRRRAPGDSCRCAFARHQRFGSLFRHTRRRDSGGDPSLFAYLAFYSHGFGILFKGKPDVVVRDGKCDLDTMRRNHVSIHDLDEDMRLSVHINDLSKVRVARVERSGNIKK